MLKEKSINLERPPPLVKWSLLIFIFIWFSFQILFPLRHLLYPGVSTWTEEGHRFAWQMMLRDKKAKALFKITNSKNNKKRIVRPEEVLPRHQARIIALWPDMILQFAQYLGEIGEKANLNGLEVNAWVCASLNGRQPQLLIDPKRDLTKVERNLKHADWILPLTQPFERLPEGERYRDLNC